MPRLSLLLFTASVGASLAVLGASCIGPRPAEHPGGRLAPMRVGRYEFQAMASGREILVVGGMDENSEVAGHVEAYDVRLNRWGSRAPLPTPRYFHCGAAVLGRLYAVGGARGDHSRETLGVVERYDPQADRWERVADLPHPRSHAAAVALDGKLHVIGGYRAGQGNLHEVDIFDPRKNAWTSGPPLPVAVHGCAAAVVQGRIHVAGGDEDMRQHLVLEGDEWKPLARIPSGRLFAEAEESGGRLYLLGGASNDEPDAFRSVLEYDPRADRWSRKADAPSPFYHFDTAVVDGKIFALGGIGLGERDPRAFRRIACYDPNEDRWSD